MRRYDVAIVGGALMGSSVAYFLATLAPSVSVCVIEPDPTYEWCSSLRASGGVRVLFSCPENIEMSKFGRDFIRSFAQRMAVDGREAPVDWVQGGYLFIVPPRALTLLEANYERQRALGCDVEWLDPRQLQARFPSMFVGDLGGAVHSTGDGWCDPNGLLQGFRRKAIALGAEYIRDRVAGLTRSGQRVVEAQLASGGTVRADAFVNATGAWAGEVCAMVGMPLPVVPLRRFEHYFTAGSPLERLPYVRTSTAWRSGRKGSDSPEGWSTAMSRAASTSRSTTGTSSTSSGPRWPTAFRRSRRPGATAPGRACTSSANSTATRSSGTGRANWRISSSSAAFRATG